jgi:hypothetical protein
MERPGIAGVVKVVNGDRRAEQKDEDEDESHWARAGEGDPALGAAGHAFDYFSAAVAARLNAHSHLQIKPYREP